MNEMTMFGLFIIWSAVMVGFGSYIGRRAMLKDFGLTWADYAAKLNGHYPA